MAAGYISEIFSTLQGEGPHMGERQIFIRTAGCPWRCRYCDTPASLTRDGHSTISVEEVLDKVHHLQEEHPHKTVSITGGEPLIQSEFLGELLPALRRLDLRTYLETSATHPDHFSRIVAECDIVAADVKLPSAVGREFWEEHRAFLSLAGAKAFVKIVLTYDTTEAELEKAISLLASLDPVPPLILQPVTAVVDLETRLSGNASGPTSTKIKPPTPHRLVNWWELARQRLPDVRLSCQMHPIWGIP